MKNRYLIIVSLTVLLLSLLAVSFLPGCTGNNAKTLYVAGSYGALSRSVYDGEITVGELKKHGDSAAGAFSAINGELVGVDGKYYRIGTQGKLSPAEDSMTTPFTTAVFFNADKTASVSQSMNYQQLQQNIDSQIPTRNIFYVIKITGTFSYIKARSLTGLSKPYTTTPYSTITQNEPTFEFHNVDSTMIGFWSPGFVETICYPGYHFHFVNGDNQYGGHLIDCQISSGKIGIGFIPNFYVALPGNADFYRADFEKNR
jgi:acetolactate decarboxylase